TAWLASVTRLGAGLRVGHLGARPAQPLELYEFEACPFCRRVREALSMLDLPAVIHPCPKGGTRFRPAVERRGGKQQFPYLIDPNTGTALFESADIVRYLARTYGDGHVPVLHQLGPVEGVSNGLTFLVRAKMSRARPTRAPAQRLELWSFEASP